MACKLQIHWAAQVARNISRRVPQIAALGGTNQPPLETVWIGSAEGNAERRVDADTPVKAASRSA